MRNLSPVVPELDLSPPPLSRVEVQLPVDPFLLTHFEDFYREVVRWKSLLASTQAATTPVSVQQQLTNFLARQRSAVEQTATLLGKEMYRQTQRICACLADEIFGRIDWPGGAKWPSLEARIFPGSEATGFAPGGQCLGKLEDLLQQGDPVYRELASVYFYALALAKPGNAGTEGYMEALTRFLPSAPAAPQWFPQSYAHTLNENKITAIPSAAKWLWLLALILVVWLGLSWFLWARLSAPVAGGLRAIHAVETSTQKPPVEKQP